MNNLHIFLWVLLIILLSGYVICWLLIIENLKSIGEMATNESTTLALLQKNEFVGSMNRNSKDMLRLQGWLMMWATIFLAIFDSQYYIISATFTASISSAHFYFAWRTV